VGPQNFGTETASTSHLAGGRLEVRRNVSEADVLLALVRLGDQAIGLDDVGNGCARDGAVSHP